MIKNDADLSNELTAAAGLLDEVAAAAAHEADAVFTPERLARQQARILHRLEQDGRPGRIIAFPGQAAETTPLRARPGTRWIAAAAVAGLLVGLLAGHLAHDLPGGGASAPALRVNDAPEPGLRVVATTFSEDEFLDQIELAADQPGGAALLPLHNATPRAWEEAAR